MCPCVFVLQSVVVNGDAPCLVAVNGTQHGTNTINTWRYIVFGQVRVLLRVRTLPREQNAARREYHGGSADLKCHFLSRISQRLGLDSLVSDALTGKFQACVNGHRTNGAHRLLHGRNNRNCSTRRVLAYRTPSLHGNNRDGSHGGKYTSPVDFVASLHALADSLTLPRFDWRSRVLRAFSAERVSWDDTHSV